MPYHLPFSPSLYLPISQSLRPSPNKNPSPINIVCPLRDSYSIESHKPSATLICFPTHTLSKQLCLPTLSDFFNHFLQSSSSIKLFNQALQSSSLINLFNQALQSSFSITSLIKLSNPSPKHQKRPLSNTSTYSRLTTSAQSGSHVQQPEIPKTSEATPFFPL